MRILGTFSTLLLLFFHPAPLQADQDKGSILYQSAAPAVFTIETRNEEGQVIATGSAFLIENGRVVTNAHVIRRGWPYLRTGPVSLPLDVVRVASGDDIAVLSMDATLDVVPLRLAADLPSEGSTIWVIGNPQGLERSISRGVVSGIRFEEGRQFLQHTAPISPGSSGGPVLNVEGAVVAITVGSLEAGQNLNFAVPSGRLLALLERGATSDFVEATAEAFRKAALPAPDWDSERDEWDRHRELVRSAFFQAAEVAPTGDDILTLAVRAREEAYENAIAAELARKALANGTSHADSARQLILAVESWKVRLGADAADIEELEGIADDVLKKRSTAWRALLVKMEALNFHHQPLDAVYQLGAQAAQYAPAEQRDYVLWRVQDAAHRRADYITADSIFKLRETSGELDQFDWSLRGSNLEERTEWLEAANAHTMAFRRSDQGVVRHTCNAGSNYWRADAPDNALVAFRACIQGYALSLYQDSIQIAFAHRGLASILSDRGVYSSAETHARQAWTVAADDPWAAHELARALLGLGRYSEARAAAEEAVRLSDGSYAAMHFTAGSAYFELKDWRRCENSFRIAAELDPVEPSAPYNVAICLQRQGFHQGAIRWYEEVLRRYPNHPDAPQIRATIRRLRARQS